MGGVCGGGVRVLMDDDFLDYENSYKVTLIINLIAIQKQGTGIFFYEPFSLPLPCGVSVTATFTDIFFKRKKWDFVKR